LSTAYQNLLSTIGFGYFVNGTVTVSGLTSGDNYQVQVWSSYPYSSPNAHTTFTGPSGSNTVTLLPENNQFALGTFTASGSTESFNYDYGNRYGLVNAVSVRELASAPEPSTVGLLGLGLLGVMLLVRHQRRAAFAAL
jgi:hypothetical protein